MEQYPDADQTVPTDADASENPGGINRRSALKYGGIAAGLVVATPSILTLGATPASASGQVANQFGGSITSAAGVAIENTPSGLSGTGIVVVSVVVAGERLEANTTVSSNTGNTWTLVTDSYRTNASPGFTMATYYAPLDGEQTSVHFKFAWTGGARAALAGTYFPTATAVNGAVTKAAPSSSTSITAPAGLVVPNRPTDNPAVLFCGGTIRTGNNAPTYTAPSGFGYQANQIYSAYGTATVTSGVGVGHSYVPIDDDWASQTYLTPTSDFGAKSATVATAQMNSATMLCIY